MKKWMFTKNDLPEKEGPYLCYVFYSGNDDPYFKQEICEFTYQKEYLVLNEHETLTRTSKQLTFDERWGSVYAWMELPENPKENEVW